MNMTDVEYNIMSNQSSLFTSTNETFLNSTVIEMGMMEHSQLKKNKKSRNKLGHLIPLACGHNGCFNEEQVQLFLMHLKNAGFVE